jgi:hypothetical protein
MIQTQPLLSRPDKQPSAVEPFLPLLLPLHLCLQGPEA